MATGDSAADAPARRDTTQAAQMGRRALGGPDEPGPTAAPAFQHDPKSNGATTGRRRAGYRDLAVGSVEAPPRLRERIVGMEL